MINWFMTVNQFLMIDFSRLIGIGWLIMPLYKKGKKADQKTGEDPIISLVSK